MEAEATRWFLNLLYKQALRPPKVDRQRGQMTLQHSPMFRWLGIVSVAFFVAMIVLSGIFGEQAALFCVIGFSVFLLLGIYMLAETLVERVIASDIGLEQRSPWRTRRRIRWDEIESVGFSKVNRWFVVAGPKSKIRISFFLVGIRECAALILKQVPAPRRVQAETGFRELQLNQG